LVRGVGPSPRPLYVLTRVIFDVYKEYSTGFAK
jgi:hypothetical protein